MCLCVTLRSPMQTKSIDGQPDKAKRKRIDDDDDDEANQFRLNEPVLWHWQPVRELAD